MAKLESSRIWWCAVVAPWLVACGGTFAPSPDAGGGAAGGPAGGASAGAASAGAASAGAAGAESAGAAGIPCVYGGNTYADGAGFPSDDGCNSCFCEGGTVSCTLRECSTGCLWDGQWYQPGQTFMQDCNTCSCDVDGTVSCTEAGCQDQCSALQDQYAAALTRAKACNSNLPDQCTTGVPDAVMCGCPTNVNASSTQALRELSELAESAAGQCFAKCVPCPAAGSSAICTAEGTCVDLRAGQIACKVGGVVYPSGASGIKDPTSCNTCSCENGALGCTKVACPIPCPTGTTAGTQCAQCGPTDGCEVIEHACLPTCSDSAACSNGTCSNGVCRQLCG